MFYTLLAFWVVLSGYCFVSTWHWTRYLLKRLPSQQLYFRSAFWGGILFTLSTVLVPYLELSATFVSMSENLSASLTSSAPESAPVQLITYAFVTSLLGVFGGFLLNWLYALREMILRPRATWQDIASLLEQPESQLKTLFCVLPKHLYAYSTLHPMRKAIEYLNLDLERMLFKAAEESQLLMLSLASNQVYIGRITGAIDPADDDDMLRILPLISGYRHADTKKFEPVNFYDEMYEQVENGSDTGVTIDSFEVAIRISDIAAVRQFNIAIYAELHSAKVELAQ